MKTQCSDIFSRLESWYGHERRSYLLTQTSAAAQDMLERAFGYHILHLGYSGEQPLSHASPINHRILCASGAGAAITRKADQRLGATHLVAEPDELPLESDSVDAVVAYHCLEFAQNPHQVLREIQRVLTPQGQLLVVGFNPYSLQGVGSRCGRALRNPLWTAHRPVSERRLTDWLHLLGCEVQEVSRLYAVPPVGSGRLGRGLAYLDAWAAAHNLPFGGVYVVHATKQVAGCTRPRLRRVRGGGLIDLVGKPVPAPTPVTPAGRALKKIENGDVAA